MRSPMTICVQYAVRRSSQCGSATLSEPEAGVAWYANRAANGSAKGDAARDGLARADFATDGFLGVPYLQADGSMRKKADVANG